MSNKFADFFRLAGRRSYLPSLAEATEMETGLDVGEVPSELVGEPGKALEMAEHGAVREMKLGVVSARTYSPKEPTKNDPAQKKKPMKLKDLVKPVDESDHHDLTAHELAAHDGSGDSHEFETDHQKRQKAARDVYYKQAGKAALDSHQAHEISSMVKSGELPHGHKAAHDAHDRAMASHKEADKLMEPAGLSHARGLHRGHIADHEKMKNHHGKKLGLY